MWRTSAEYPTKSRRSLVAVLTVFAVEIEEVDFARPVARILTVVEAMPMLFGTATRNPVLRPRRRCVRQYRDMGPHCHYLKSPKERPSVMTNNLSERLQLLHELQYSDLDMLVMGVCLQISRRLVTSTYSLPHLVIAHPKKNSFRDGSVCH